MDRRDEKVVCFPKPGRPRRARRRRVGDSPVKIVVLLLVFAALFGAFSAKDHLTNFRPDEWFPSALVPSLELTGLAQITDGDTLRLAGVRLRLFGVDAPELEQTCNDGAGQTYNCGKAAARALQRKIAGQANSYRQEDIDRYGRRVAICFLNGEDLNRWLVAQGWAVAYRRFSRDYVEAKAAARHARQGLWQGPFDEPAEWRRQNH